LLKRDFVSSGAKTKFISKIEGETALCTAFQRENKQKRCWTHTVKWYWNFCTTAATTFWSHKVALKIVINLKQF